MPLRVSTRNRRSTRSEGQAEPATLHQRARHEYRAGLARDCHRSGGYCDVPGCTLLHPAACIEAGSPARHGRRRHVLGKDMLMTISRVAGADRQERITLCLVS